jgi:hypothetical protein
MARRTAAVGVATSVLIAILTLRAGAPTTSVVRAAPGAPHYRLVDLGPVAGNVESYANAVNASGTAVGTSDDPTRYLPVRWSETGEAVVLPLLPGTIRTTLNDINDHGVAVGDANDAAFSFIAARWVGDKPESLAPLGHAFAINNAAQVAGAIPDPSTGYLTAAVWDHGTVTRLPAYFRLFGPPAARPWNSTIPASPWATPSPIPATARSTGATASSTALVPSPAPSRSAPSA